MPRDARLSGPRGNTRISPLTGLGPPLSPLITTLIATRLRPLITTLISCGGTLALAKLRPLTLLGVNEWACVAFLALSHLMKLARYRFPLGGIRIWTSKR